MAHVLSDSIEGVGFMSCTVANHSGAMEMHCRQSSGASMLSIFYLMVHTGRQRSLFFIPDKLSARIFSDDIIHPRLKVLIRISATKDLCN